MYKKSIVCNLCATASVNFSFDHYNEKRHAQTLKKHFQNWKKNKQAQRQVVQVKRIQNSGPGFTSSSGLTNCYKLICTKCAKRGHERRDCPQNLICGRCGLSSHFRKDLFNCILASVEDSDEDHDIELIDPPPPKPAPQFVDLEETEPVDEMPTFEMDSTYIEDRIKQEIIFEVPVPNIGQGFEK